MRGIKKKKGNFSWGNILVLSAWVFGGLLVLAGAAYAAVAYDQAARQKDLERMTYILKDIERKVYEKQNQGLFGGKTPAETIYLYYEFLESRDFNIVSTYFVPEMRAGELNRYNGFPENELLAFIEKLRAAEIKARSADASLSSYEMKTPLYIKMKKMPNGVWEFEYLGQLGD